MIGLIAYEMPHLRGGAATTVLVGLETRIHEIADERGVAYSKVHSATIKKLVAGNGKASKDDIKRWASGVTGRAIDDDEADAIAILRWGISQSTNAPVLALDLGTRTGWAVGHWDSEGETGMHIVESGVQDFSLRRGESAGFRFMMFRRWLESMLTDGWDGIPF